MVGRILRWPQWVLYNLFPLSLGGTREHVTPMIMPHLTAKGIFADVIDDTWEPFKGTGPFLEKGIWSVAWIWCRRNSSVARFKDGGVHAASSRAGSISRQRKWDTSGTVKRTWIRSPSCEVGRQSWDPGEHTSQLTRWFYPERPCVRISAMWHPDVWPTELWATRFGGNLLCSTRRLIQGTLRVH